MKIIIAVLTLVMAASAQAKLRWTMEECRAEYGQEVKSEGAWCGGRAYGFIKNGLYIYAIIPNNQNTVADITYFHNNVVWGLSNAECEKLWVANQGDKGWDQGSDLNWAIQNRRKKYKKLGLENFEHVIQWDRENKYGNVGNRKDNGYQVRTVQQFYKEQKEIKALVKKGPVKTIIATL